MVVSCHLLHLHSRKCLDLSLPPKRAVDAGQIIVLQMIFKFAQLKTGDDGIAGGSVYFHIFLQALHI